MRDFVTSSTPTSLPIAPVDHATASVVQLRCPACHRGPCRSSSLTEPSCPACGYVFSECEGIYNALPPDRESTFRQFVDDYESVRAKEGRSSSRADYYLALPFRDLTGRNVWQWHIRARTYRYVERCLLGQIAHSYPQGCAVLAV